MSIGAFRQQYAPQPLKRFDCKYGKSLRHNLPFPTSNFCNHVMGLHNVNSCSLKLSSDSSQVSQILVHYHKYDNELEGRKSCQNLLSFIATLWIPVSIHITILEKVAFETNHLESVYDESKSLVEMLISSVPFFPSCLAQVHRRLSLCYINYVVLNNKLKKATSLWTLKNETTAIQ